ncbi:MAG: glycogen synthase GlgA [Candidatus Hydrogenedentota bacterium]|nr:MAG: glycogen synthase GlgA [Candidatus Hydrogenedentota bacterium]
MKVLFVTSEMRPYAQTGGLSDVAAALPKVLRRLGVETAVIMPRYGSVERSRLDTVCEFAVPFGSEQLPASILMDRTREGVAVYFVDAPRFFDRAGLYGENGRDYEDNAARFIFFSHAAVLFAKHGPFLPEIIHANDWFTGLVPVYLKTLYSGEASLARIRTVFTIHNLAYQGIFWHHEFPLTGLPWEVFRYDQLEFYGKMNLLKGGIAFADRITTVSPRYAREILTAEFGCGLDAVLRFRERHLSGIVNGIDTEVWNPAEDPYLPSTYSADDLSGKYRCREELQGLNNLPISDAPLVGFIGRLTEQKGIDILLAAFERLMERGVQFVLLGTGESRYETAFEELGRRYPLQCGINVTFSDELAHRIEAGCDLFLMPSRFEPCGLNQLYSHRYGTPPIVHAVGGLADTVEEFEEATRRGNGFRFEQYSAEALLDALDRAVAVRSHPEAWGRLIGNCMATDWSWERSAKEYHSLYSELLAEALSGVEPFHPAHATTGRHGSWKEKV